MSQLHLIKTESAYIKAKSFIQNLDHILLMEEAVYLSVEQPEIFQKKSNCHFLYEDLDLRGLLTLTKNKQINIINIIEMVKLVKTTEKTITWF